MFEVTSYNHPLLLVMSRRTGETYRFLVGKDGALVSEGWPAPGSVDSRLS